MHNKIIKGTFILTISGILSKLIGFYYRIFLSDTIGANGVGIYQMILPVIGLFAAISCAGVEVAMSKNISSSGTKEKRYENFKTGFIYAFSMSVFSTILLLLLIPVISHFYISGLIIKKLLFMSAFLLPLMSIHSAILGYYLGMKRSFIPGLFLFIETLLKLFFTVIIYFIFIKTNKSVTPFIPILGMMLSEFFSSFILIFLIKKEFKNIKKSHFISLTLYKKFFKLAMPVSVTRILLSVVHTLEAFLVPFLLVIFGLSENDSISVYGILNGMSIPFILFPCAITNALSAMLLPSISEAASKNDFNLIKKTSSIALKYCMSMGIFFTGFFIINGYDLGYMFFGNELAGQFLQTLAWLSPFIYVGITLSSIINGFGYTKNTLIYNIISSIIRIIFIIIFIPFFGVKGYLFGLLAGEITNTLLSILKINKICHPSYSLFDNLFKPIAITIISIGFSSSLRYLIDGIKLFPNILTFIFSAGISVIVFLILMMEPSH